MPANMQMFAPRPGERSRNSLEPVAIEAWDLLQIVQVTPSLTLNIQRPRSLE